MPARAYGDRTAEDALQDAAGGSSTAGRSIYEMCWEALDEAYAAMKVADGELRKEFLRGKCLGLAEAIRWLSPWTYDRTTKTVQAEAKRRWEERQDA